MTDTRKVAFDKPVKRGDKEISEVTLSEPTAGSMRGLQVSLIQAGDVSATIQLLGRITSPSLTDAEIDAMPARDFMALSRGVMGFLFSREDAAAMGLN